MTNSIRRKKTVTDIKAGRIKRERAKEITRQKNKDLCWEDLTRLYMKCRGSLNVIDPVTTIIRDKALMDRLGVDGRKTLSKKATYLLRDVNIYRGTLEDILQKHKGKTGGEDDPMLIVDALAIGEEYQQWLASFHDVIVVNVGDILEYVDDILNPKPVVTETANVE